MSTPAIPDNQFHHTLDQVLTLTSTVAAGVDAIADTTILNTATYDTALLCFGNFLKGTYKQNPTNIEESLSTVQAITGGLADAACFLRKRPAQNSSTNEDVVPLTGACQNYSPFVIEQSGVIIPFGTTYTMVDSANVAVAFPVPLDSTASELSPMVSFEGDVDASGALQHKKSSVGHGLFQAVSGAIWKQYGRNAAINNDDDLIAELNEEFENIFIGASADPNSAWSTHAASILAGNGNGPALGHSAAVDHRFFQAYVQSGKYAEDGPGTGYDQGADTPYNMDGVSVSLKVIIRGSTQDGSNPSAPIDTTAKIHAIYGIAEVTNSPNNPNHLIWGGAADEGSGIGRERKVGEYATTVYLKLTHLDALA